VSVKGGLLGDLPQEQAAALYFLSFFGVLGGYDVMTPVSLEFSMGLRWRWLYPLDFWWFR
jgi:hypothetical protein